MTALAPPASPQACTRRFFLRRLHSLSGVLPLGVFLLEHLWTNASAAYGRVAFTHAVGELQSIPALPALELVGIALPLVFHAVYGLQIVREGGANVRGYSYPRNWLYVLQRASGLVALVFLFVHLWQYRIAKLLGRLAWPDFYAQLAVDLNQPLLYALYALGVTATVFHFANGLWQSGATWGLVASERGARRAAWACGALGAGLWLLGMNTLWHFAVRCGGVFPMTAEQAIAVCGAAR